MDSSKLLSALLAIEAALGGVGLALAGTNPVQGPFGRAMTMAGYLVVLVTCAIAGWLEIRHEKHAEGFALGALAIAWIMALLGGLQAQWILAPIQAVVAFAAAFALVDRFIEKDAAGHESHH